MNFLNNVSYMVKILTFYIIMMKIFYHIIKRSIMYGLLDCTISFELYMTLMRVRTQKPTINNNVRAIEKMVLLIPVKSKTSLLPPTTFHALLLGLEITKSAKYIFSCASYVCLRKIQVFYIYINTIYVNKSHHSCS